VVGGAPSAPLGPAYWDLDLRVKAMNRAGVGIQALSLTSPMTYFAKGDLDGAWPRLQRRPGRGAHRVSRPLRRMRDAADAGADRWR